MKQQEVFKKIGGIIKEINEQYEYLQTGGVLNDLELELLLANSHFLADHIEVLRKIGRQAESIAPATPEILPPFAGQTTVIDEEPQEPEPRYFEPEIEPAITLHETEIAEPAPVIEFDMPPPPAQQPETAQPEQFDAEPVEPETIRHELTMEDIGEDWEEEENEAEETYNNLKNIIPEPEPVAVQPETKQESNAQPTVKPEPQIAEEEEILTLNQKMSARMATSRMSDHLGAQAVTDLKSAISLNDKLLYIKDLFNGYSLAYSEAIEILNRYKTFEEAEKFLQASYATKNNWADKQATVDKLYELLKRRY